MMNDLNKKTIAEKFRYLLDSCLYRSFLNGGSDAGQRVSFEYDFSNGLNCVQGYVDFGPLAEGPPQHVHGGCISSVLDQTMGAAVFLKGIFAMTAEMQVTYKRPIPINSRQSFFAKVESQDGRKFYTTSQLADSQGQVFALGRGIFVQVPKEKLGLADAKLIETVEALFQVEK
jgi:hypothetical protein